MTDDVVDATMTPEQLREYEAIFNEDPPRNHRPRFLPPEE